MTKKLLGSPPDSGSDSKCSNQDSGTSSTHSNVTVITYEKDPLLSNYDSDSAINMNTGICCEPRSMKIDPMAQLSEVDTSENPWIESDSMLPNYNRPSDLTGSVTCMYEVIEDDSYSCNIDIEEDMVGETGFNDGIVNTDGCGNYCIAEKNGPIKEQICRSSEPCETTTDISFIGGDFDSNARLANQVGDEEDVDEERAVKNTKEFVFYNQNNISPETCNVYNSCIQEHSSTPEDHTPPSDQCPTEMPHQTMACQSNTDGSCIITSDSLSGLAPNSDDSLSGLALNSDMMGGYARSTQLAEPDCISVCDSEEEEDDDVKVDIDDDVLETLDTVEDTETDTETERNTGSDDKDKTETNVKNKLCHTDALDAHHETDKCDLKPDIESYGIEGKNVNGLRAVIDVQGQEIHSSGNYQMVTLDSNSAERSNGESSGLDNSVVC